ncbi:hypothetical protein HYPSUDRAFT_207416 [Hypholoma sublateritium FD-334 SS-4]|uniref:Uncharacterized protein n=1 Tax=Hypholoma sublateritium (strain FD-334 SS-4) TaxID=945553 RepID=A0A0D2P6F9_HYPSF|nr:hypothetical protein HYPSUDRAFT_207416 [Hypholoma sublateritium FD-334 SS-4]
MTDYLDQRHSGYGQSYRGTDPNMDEEAMRRSLTRGSHQSQTSGVTASTKSWVYSQARQPPPPLDESVSSAGVDTNLRRPRPLPVEPPFRQSRVPVKYEMALDPGMEEPHPFTHMGVDTKNFPFGYQNQDMYGHMPEPSFSPAPPVLEPQPEDGPNRSFVGGFFKGLKRLPKMLGGAKKGEAQRLKRKGTFGTEGTSTTATGIERGNTLPRYLSNPSIGPSNPQFAHRLSMAMVSGTLPPSATPGGFHHRDNPNPMHPPNGPTYPYGNDVPVRDNPAGPQHPIVTLTPPSDGIVEEEQADFYDGPVAEYPQHHLEDIMENEPSLRGRATVMVYSTESQAPAMTSPVPTPSPRRGNTPGRVSYQQELPTRASVQAQTESMPGPSGLGPSPSPMRPITASTQPMLQSPNSFLSPTSTSEQYTMSTFASHYDPSFASHLSPIEKFFKGLYNLPWVAERVTVDYRPPDSDRAKKKPMSSWYRAMLTRSRRISQNIDIMSNGTGTISGLDLGSPISPRRSERSSNRRHHSGKAKGSRRPRHRVSSDTHHTRAPSPIVPTPYPYTYPAVYQYPYPYNGYMPVPQTAPRGPRAHHRRKGSKRHAAVATAATGYPAYQAMAMPPPQPMPQPQPIYFIAPSPPQSHTGGAIAGEGEQSAQQIQQAQYAAQYQQQYQPQGPMQISPVIMQYVPGALNQNPSMPVSPPLTPQRHAKHAAS